MGVTYGCEILQPTPEGHGIVHWVRIDLAAAGIELYVTPLDPAAVTEGWQYRLRWIDDVMRTERLAVAINGTLFASIPDWRPRMAGDLARSTDMVVSDHVVSHLSDRYLLLFDDKLIPNLPQSRPPAPAELRLAKWGIGAQVVWLRGGGVWPASDRRPDSRTAIAVDQRRRLLFLAVGQWISPHHLLGKLAGMGAVDGVLLDGGGSSAIAIGRGARNLAPGTLLGGSRPVATYFGVRAQPIRTE